MPCKQATNQVRQMDIMLGYDVYFQTLESVLNVNGVRCFYTGLFQPSMLEESERVRVSMD